MPQHQQKPRSERVQRSERSVSFYERMIKGTPRHQGARALHAGRGFVSTNGLDNPFRKLMSSWTRSFSHYFDSSLAMRKSFASEYFSGVENPGTTRWHSCPILSDLCLSFTPKIG